MGKSYKRQKKPFKRRKRKVTYKEYSQQCRFKFKIEDYKKEFDVKLINSLGWYSASNPTGVSRDHMLSISLGWKMNIPPNVMRHPANCELMIFEDNRQKGGRSSINYDQLMKRIDTWNKTYK